MKYTKTISFIGATLNLTMTIVCLLRGRLDEASIWGIATIWAVSNSFNEFKIEDKEKQIKNLESLLEQNNERTSVQN